jgi:hypothetical protein
MFHSPIRPFILGILLLCIDHVVAAQSIRNFAAHFDGEQVIITYDLMSDDAADRFDVGLYSSIDNYQQKLSLLVGDAGENVEPGTEKRITWDAKRSLPDKFDQEIIFKIKANLMVSLNHPNRLALKPLDFNAYKRGGVVNMEWNGGKANEHITIELLKENEVVSKITDVENNNLYSWNIPKKAKTGKEYSIRISKTENPLIQAATIPFEIKPKVSLLTKLIPVLVAGGVVAVLSGGSDEEAPDLPGPPKPGE